MIIQCRGVTSDRKGEPRCQCGATGCPMICDEYKGTTYEIKTYPKIQQLMDPIVRKRKRDYAMPWSKR